MSSWNQLVTTVISEGEASSLTGSEKSFAVGRDVVAATRPSPVAAPPSAPPQQSSDIVHTVTGSRLIALAALVSISACARAEAPDVQLLVVDTLRADHIGLHGYERDTSPELDQFAQQAVVFDHTFAPSSWTLPSVASLFTGLYPSVHGLIARRGAEGVTSIRPEVPTLPELMRAGGYRTVAIVTNPWFEAKHGLVRGFEEFQFADPPTAGRVRQLATQALSNDDPRPVFLYLHYMDVHGPYGANGESDRNDLGPVPEEYVRNLTTEEQDSVDRYLRLEGVHRLDGYIDAYDRGIRYWDKEFGLWLDWLRQNDRLPNTILTVLSDHGEEFLEHGGWNHGETLYQELLWVPWLMYIPEESGRRLQDRVVSLVDFGPTLFGLLGKEAPPGWVGANALAPSPGIFNRAVFSQLERKDSDKSKKAVRTADMKLIETENGTECYDLRTDPREGNPLISEAPCMGQLRQELSAFRIRSSPLATGRAGGGSEELSPELLKRLRSLGYVR